jgi:hypothetical protein
MKRIVAALATLVLVSSPLALAQDQDTDEQLKDANEAAKHLGMKMPDVKKIIDENAKEDAADQAVSPAAPTNDASPAATPNGSARPKVPVSLAAGSANGSLTFNGSTSELKFASAFVDQKDSRRPVILLITDLKLPSDKWTSEFDMMRDQSKWSGIALFLDKDGTIFRSDVHTKGQQSSVSGMFDVNINDPTSQDLAGMAKTDSATSENKLDVTFHATRK